MEKTAKSASEGSARFRWQLTNVQDSGVVKHGSGNGRRFTVRNEQTKSGNAEDALGVADAAISESSNGQLGRITNSIASSAFHTLRFTFNAIGKGCRCLVRVFAPPLEKHGLRLREKVALVTRSGVSTALMEVPKEWNSWSS